MEYAGFCPVALVSGQGFVLPGNRRIGYLGHDGKFYSPSTVDRAEQVSTFFKVEKIQENSSIGQEILLEDVEVIRQNIAG